MTALMTSGLSAPDGEFKVIRHKVGVLFSSL